MAQGRPRRGRQQMRRNTVSLAGAEPGVHHALIPYTNAANQAYKAPYGAMISDTEPRQTRLIHHARAGIDGAIGDGGTQRRAGSEHHLLGRCLSVEMAS